MSDDGLDRLIAAEQDERRRIALFLHDGPVQNLSGIALMLDAALHSIETGKLDDARDVLGSALDRQREHDPRAARPLVRARAGRAARPGLRPGARGARRADRHVEPDPHRPRPRRLGPRRRNGAGRALHDRPRAARPGGAARAAHPDRGRRCGRSTAAASRRSSPTTPSRSGAGGRSRGSRSA